MEREKADEEPAPRARMARAFGVAIMVYLQEFKKVQDQEEEEERQMTCPLFVHKHKGKI